MSQTVYERLFGTPEKAAATLTLNCYGTYGEACEWCLIAECDEKLCHSKKAVEVRNGIYDMLMKEARP